MRQRCSFGRMLTLGFAGLTAAVSRSLQVETSAQQPAAPASSTPRGLTQRQLLDRYCVTCHNDKAKTAGLSLQHVDPASPAAAPEVWEKVVRKVHTGVMPPPNMPQPSNDDRRLLLTWLESELDAASIAKPNPGRTETLRRLNRTEYQNAIRDLLAVDVDATALLPPDESGHGFDNVNVGDLSPMLLDRYVSAAQKISRLAVGSTQTSLQADIIRLPADLTQENHVPGLPIGTRGGIVVRHTFPLDAEYDLQVGQAGGGAN